MFLLLLCPVYSILFSVSINISIIFLNDAFPSVSLSVVVLAEMMKPFPEDVALHFVLLFFLFFWLLVVWDCFVHH